MLATHAARMAAALVALALGAPALAQTADTLVERYTPLAGSERNAGALVTGLRDGTKITLGSGASATTIAPPTQKMGFGNVDNALALTEASLRQQGIDEPTPEQLKTALLSVLESRADGKGWGEIANAMGFRLGDLKRAERAPELKRAERAPERVARAARPERPEKVERPQRPERPERPMKPERPGR